MDYSIKLSAEFKIRQDHAKNIIALIDDGNTIPFIARYRKEMTGSCDDQVLREIFDRLKYLRSLDKRKQEIVDSITEQGKMTDEIMLAIAKAETMTEAEDIYRPYKQKKKTRASVAIEKGLSPLAEFILSSENAEISIDEKAKEFINEEKGVTDIALAKAGANDIIAEIISDNAEVRKILRKKLFDDMKSEIEKGVNEKLKGSGAASTPKKGSASGMTAEQILSVANRAERQRLINENMHLFQ